MIYPCQIKSYKFCSLKCKSGFVRRNIDIEDVIKMYTIDFIGIYTITKKYNVSQSVITDILLKNGVKLRDKTWILYNRPPFKGYKYTEEQKENIRKRAIKAYENNPNLKNIIRQKTLKQISEGRMPKANTSIEKIMSDILTGMGISFEFQKIFAFWCFDFYLPEYNLFIECDGDYWHGHPDQYSKTKLNDTQKNNIHRGKQKENYVIKRGYNLIRFWECDLNNDIDKIKEKICNLIKNIS